MTRRDQLAHLLAAHRPADDLEASHVAAMHTLLDGSADPFSRSHWNPGHFTASAFVLSPDRASVLLIFHGKLHRWLQPGGHVDPEDADIIAAARREITEEVGLSNLTLNGPGIFDVDVHTIPALKTDPSHHHFDVRFLFIAASRDFVVGSDARDGRWFDLQQVHTVETDASVLRAIAKLQ